MLTCRTCVTVFSILMMTSFAPAEAKTPKAWKVDELLKGKPDGKDFKKAEDVSGIACALGTVLPRLCMVVDDESQGAQIVLLNKDSLTAGDFIPLTSAQFEGKPLELDAEAVAFDNNSFYVVGSHGQPRHPDDKPEKAKKNDAKAEASRFIYRIFLKASQVDMTTGKLRDKPLISAPATLTSILKRFPAIAAAYDKPLEENGLTVEGIAVLDKRLYIGMRGPVIGDKAAVVSVGLAGVFDSSPPVPKLHEIRLGTDKRGKVRGIRDIVRHGDGFLVLAGPVNDPEGDVVEDGDYAIFPWDGSSQPSKYADLDSFGTAVKPEALLSLSGDTRRARLLVMFDGPKEGSPTPIEVEFKPASASGARRPR